MWLGESQWWHGFRRLIGAGLLTVSISFGATGSAESSLRLHKVVKGESLTSVSQKYGIKISRMASSNGLATDERLKIGQTLLIPSTAAAGPPLPASVRQSIEKAPVKLGRWKNIVLHHSGTAEGSAKGMENYHRRVRHMENGLAYHFVIGNGHGMKDGEIFVGNRWTRQIDGGHLHSLAQNKVSLGICLVGNFEKTKPTAAQLKSLKALLSALEIRCGIADSGVTTHREINDVGTRCPGRYFPVSAIEKELAAMAP